VLVIVPGPVRSGIARGKIARGENLDADWRPAQKGRYWWQAIVHIRGKRPVRIATAWRRCRHDAAHTKRAATLASKAKSAMKAAAIREIRPCPERAGAATTISHARSAMVAVNRLRGEAYCEIFRGVERHSRVPGRGMPSGGQASPAIYSSKFRLH
jgi:hypothetical protein